MVMRPHSGVAAQQSVMCDNKHTKWLGSVTETEASKLMNFNKTQQHSSSLIGTVDTFEVLIVSISIRDEEKISTESELNLRK